MEKPVSILIFILDLGLGALIGTLLLAPVKLAIPLNVIAFSILILFCVGMVRILINPKTLAESAVAIIIGLLSFIWIDINYLRPIQFGIVLFFMPGFYTVVILPVLAGMALGKNIRCTKSKKTKKLSIILSVVAMTVTAVIAFEPLTKIAQQSQEVKIIKELPSPCINNPETGAPLAGCNQTSTEISKPK